MTTFLVTAVVFLILFDLFVIVLAVVAFRRMLGASNQIIEIAHQAADEVVAEQTKKARGKTPISPEKNVA